MKKIRNVEIHRLIEQNRNDWRRNPNGEYGNHYLERTYKTYVDLFLSHFPKYCVEGIEQFHRSGNTHLACQLFEGQILGSKPIWLVANMLATHHPYATIQHNELSEAVVEIYTKRNYRRRYQREDVHFSNTRRTLRQYLNKVSRKMAEISSDNCFLRYEGKFFYTQDIKDFRFRLSTHGADHYQFTFDFFKYEYKFSEKHNGFVFTRRVDKGNNEVICFITQLCGYCREAKLLKGTYSRNTDEFTPKNINFIKKYL